MTWYDDYRSGKLGPLSTRLGTASETFEDAISEWTASGSDTPLHEFLGLTWQQYAFTVWYPEMMMVPTPEFAEGFYAGYNQGYRDAEKEKNR